MSSKLNKEFISITVDKSHIITIGERLYSESLEFIRELVNNAYDADATIVDITVNDKAIEISDNGVGMDREGISQYFNIGSQLKIDLSQSPVYKRDRIGQFGIGKFASLAACERFDLLTKKGDFVGRVVFDKEEWEKAGDNWHLPLEVLKPNFRKENGTTIVLYDLNREFDLKEIETRIIEGTPLKSPNFKVRLNGHVIKPRSLSGHMIPFLEGTSYGPVSGEIVILPETASSKDNLGIEVKVKGVTVRRELFGMETWGKAMARVRGEVRADFLPITSDRTGFIKDSPEYLEFVRVMEKLTNEVKNVLKRLSGRKANRIVSRALKESLQRVYKALARNPEFSPFGALPIGDEEGIGGAAYKSKGGNGKDEVVKPEDGVHSLAEAKQKKKRKKKPKVRELTPNAVIKKMKFGDTGVSCIVDSFGEEGPETFSEGSIIYINRDHPLYKRESKRFDTHILNISRLLTQEIALMKDHKNPRQAFDRQSKLLKDAFSE